MTDQSSIAVFKMTSWGVAHLAANLLFREFPDIVLLEMSPLGEHAQLILQGPEARLNQFRKSISQADLLRTEIIFDPSQKVIESYFSLQTRDLKSFLIVMESDFLGDLMKIASALAYGAGEIIELRQLRGYKGQAHLLVTGSDLNTVRNEIENAQVSSIRMSVISDIHQGLRNYLSLSN